MEFSDSFTNPFYAAALAKFANPAYVGIVYIESEQDISFWSEMLNQAKAPSHKFVVGITSNSEKDKRGKAQDLKYYQHANAAALIAIDSDFDYLAESAHPEGQLISANPFVLQTYAYSVENLNFAAATIDSCLKKNRFFLDNDHRISDFVARYSTVIYPVLCKYLCVIDNQVDHYLANFENFHQRVCYIDLEKTYFDSDCDQGWADFNQTIEVFHAALSGVTAALEFDAFEAHLAHKGLSQTNAYQFIQGHTFEDLITKLVIKITTNQKLAEVERIKNNCDPKEINKRKSEMDNHFKKRCHFETLVHTSQLKFEDPIVNRIISHIESLKLN
jgi:hypothetical protein